MPNYFTTFKSKHGIDYSIESTDDYKFHPQDFYDLVKLFNDPKVYKYITEDALKIWYKDNPYIEVQAMDWLMTTSKYWKELNQYRFIIRNLEGKRFVGVILYEPRDDNWFESSSFKISTEPSFMKVARKVSFEFAKSLGITKIFALIEPNNLISIKSTEELGYSYIGDVIEDGKLLRRYELHLNSENMN